MDTKIVEVTFRMLLVDEVGEQLSDDRAKKIATMSADAIEQRLVKEGFLPSDILLDSYNINEEVISL